MTAATGAPVRTGSGAAKWRRRPVPVLLALGSIVVTLGIATAMRPVRLAEVLLIVLVEVIAVSLVAGRTVAAGTALGSFVAVNWLLVPPYGTLQIANEGNWVTLAVFLLLAVGVSTLVESVLASERLAASAAAREGALTEALRPGEASAADVLEVLRAELDLTTAAIVDPATGARLSVSDPEGEAAELPPSGTAVMTVDVGPGFRVLGWGPGTLGAHPEYVTSLATAAVRAWESERLVEEQERSARLAEIDAARAALLASVGHDLRTPLAGMRVSVDALAMAGDDLSEADRRALLDELRESALRLDTLLDGVLEAARIESGAAAQPAPTDLRVVVDAAVRDFDSPRLHVAGAAQPVMALVDAVVAERVVANLVSNALAHTPEGSQVEVVVGDLTTSPTILVVDHGPGLRQDRDAPDRGRQRQGMGLLIVDRLARFASIEVVAGTTDGGGTTFTLRFPVVA